MVDERFSPDAVFLLRVALGVMFLAHSVVLKLMTFGLGRGIEYYDMPAVRKVVREAARQDYRFSAILTAIAESEPFRYGTVPGTEDELEAHAAAGP